MFRLPSSYFRTQSAKRSSVYKHSYFFLSFFSAHMWKATQNLPGPTSSTIQYYSDPHSQTLSISTVLFGSHLTHQPLNSIHCAVYHFLGLPQKTSKRLAASPGSILSRTFPEKRTSTSVSTKREFQIQTLLSCVLKACQKPTECSVSLILTTSISWAICLLLWAISSIVVLCFPKTS